jgi:DNA-binding CsgD family transcriptional regulator
MPFVGRTSELAQLDDALAAVSAGEARAIEVLGPAGIGKTRLLAELAAKAEARGHLVLAGAGAELERDLPFWVFVDALDEYVEGLDPRRLERLDDAIKADLAQVLPALAGASGADQGGLHERYRMHRAIRELLDDFHWADPASIDLLVALLRRPPAAGVLFTLAARPRQLPPRLATALDRAHRDGMLWRLELATLTLEEARGIVGRDADALYEESGGNPFFLEQLARAPRRPGAGAVEMVGVPGPVASALSEELSLLSAPARRALDGASVAGDPFEVDIATIAAGLPEPEFLDALDELVAADFVRATDMPRRFRFRHPIVRRAVYEATPGGWRLSAHERVATLLTDRGATPTARAHHVERSARHGDAAAIATLREAGEESASRAPATAARWFEAAARLLPDDAPVTERVPLLLARARALIATGQFADGHATLRSCLELLGPGASELRVQAATSCARVEHLLGLHEQAHERLLAALDELPDAGTPDGVSLMIELVMDGMHRMNYAAMHEWGARALAAAERLDDPALRAAALAAAARGSAVGGRNAEATERHAAAAELIDNLPDNVLARRLDALATLAGAELYLHLWDDAHAHAERAIAIGRRTDQGQQFPLLYAILGMTNYFRGRARETVDALDGAVEAARLSGNAQTLAWSLYPRAMAALALGDLATASTASWAADSAVDDGRPSHHFSHAAFALAEAQLELGKPARAVELLERSGAGPDLPLVAPSYRALFLEALVRARLAAGDKEGARRAAEVARAHTDSHDGFASQRGWALRAQAAVALDDGDARDAAELALSSAAELDAHGACVERSRSLTVAGRALAAAGERERARDVLVQAAEELDRRGAVRYRDAAERELRRLGHRIHRRTAAGVGVGGLTPRELEIARRIVDRRTNRQIAEELFLSPKTVETHVRNIFAKLGADSRVEVAQIVERADRLAG